MTSPRIHWIVERSPRDEDSDPALALVTGRTSARDDIGRLIATLIRARVPVTVVRKPPFADFMLPIGSDEPLELSFDVPVFAYGSTTMELVSRRLGWEPGFIDGPPMDECDAAWGAHMLNFGSRLEILGTMAVPDEDVFIRPVDDGKSFAGKIETPEGFESWRAGILDVKGWTNLPPETRVVVARPRSIDCEWRIPVVGGRAVTASSYREQGRLRCTTGAPSEVLDFVAARVAEWNPRRAFVMDVASTDDGLRIVETNSISSAGLYAIGQEAYVAAITGEIAR
jgi:hypothetical protein